MFTKLAQLWIVYHEPTAQNLAILQSADDAHLWIHEYVSEDMKVDCFIESVYSYVRDGYVYKASEDDE